PDRHTGRHPGFDADVTPRDLVVEEPLEHRLGEGVFREDEDVRSGHRIWVLLSLRVRRRRGGTVVRTGERVAISAGPSPSYRPSPPGPKADRRVRTGGRVSVA